MQALFQSIQQKFMKKKVPDIRPGYTVRVHQKIKEGEKERIQVFEGLVIAVNSGNGMSKSFTVRKLVDGIGVEKIFPLHSNLIEKIEVKRASKVRRAKLYYMRDLRGRAARLRETELRLQEQEIEESAAHLAKEKAKQEAAEVQADQENTAEEGDTPAETTEKGEATKTEPERAVVEVEKVAPTDESGEGDTPDEEKNPETAIEKGSSEEPEDASEEKK